MTAAPARREVVHLPASAAAAPSRPPTCPACGRPFPDAAEPGLGRLLLAELERAPGASGSELARRVGRRKQDVLRELDRLRRAGLAERELGRRGFRWRLAGTTREPEPSAAGVAYAPAVVELVVQLLLAPFCGPPRGRLLALLALAAYLAALVAAVLEEGGR